MFSNYQSQRGGAMKSFYLKAGAIFLVLALWSGVSMASPIFVGDSYDLPDSADQSQQDTQDNVNVLMNFYNDEKDPDLPAPLTLLGKWEWDDNDANKRKWDKSIDPGFTGSFMTAGGISGDWAVSDSWNPTTPLYYSIKAGSDNGNSGGGFALWYANGLLEGTWNTSGLNNHGLSHISFWTADGTVPPHNPVPEPGTMALLGIGLITIAGYSRKRYSR
jgi:hypothetical protein